jgi:hypothetical protein
MGYSLHNYNDEHVYASTDGIHILFPDGKPYVGTGMFHVCTSPFGTFLLEELPNEQTALITACKHTEVEGIIEWIYGGNRDG